MSLTALPWRYDLGMDYTEFMLWKAAILIAAAFIAGVMGWLR
jgi:hypothetical protein